MADRNSIVEKIKALLAKTTANGRRARRESFVLPVPWGRVPGRGCRSLKIDLMNPLFELRSPGFQCPRATVALRPPRPSHPRHGIQATGAGAHLSSTAANQMKSMIEMRSPASACLRASSTLRPPAARPEGW